MKRSAALGLCAALLFFATAAFAHDSGISQLRLRLDGTQLDGEWEIHYDDALTLLGLPAEPEDDQAWLDVRANVDSLRRALRARIGVTNGGDTCPIRIKSDTLRRNLEQGTVILTLTADCAVVPEDLGMSCEILFDIDPRHRAFFSVQDDRVTHVGVFKNHERTVQFKVRTFNVWSTILEFTREGLWHIWTGLDHVLFLLALLLPAPLLRNNATWEPRRGFWPVAREVLKVVTAFTLAHTLTLCLSFFGVVSLPSRLTESVIAFSVFVAAWNNLRPFLPGRTWIMALTFGLIHGLGFAGALRGLALPGQARGLALGTFNLGVELGQMAIVAVVLPLIYLASRQPGYPRKVMGVGSLLIAWVAAVWTLERAGGLTLLP